MLSAIHLDNQFHIKAYKVEDEIAIWMLPAKFVAIELFAAQLLLKFFLSICHRIAQFALQFVGENILVGLAFHDFTFSDIY